MNINRDRAADLGVSISDIGGTLEVMLGQRRVSTFLDRGEEYDVILEGIEDDFRSPNNIENLYVRSARTGELIPMDNLLTFEEQATSSRLNRYNRMRAVTISANLAEGYTLGEALAYLENIVATELPDNVSIDWNQVIFKGLTIKGIYGREMFETWYKMASLIQSGLDLSPIITHEFPLAEFAEGFETMNSGQSGKVILDWQ